MRLILSVLALLSVALAQTEPPPLNASDISIVQVTYSGNGCPQGTVATSFSFNKQTITFSFSGIQIFTGPGTTVAASSRNCSIRLQLRYPAGWAFTIPKIRWHGYFSLPEGIIASFRSTFELLSRDLQVISFPAATLNGTSAVPARLFDKELAALDDYGVPLRSMCSSSGGGSFATDIIVARDRWALTRTRADASLGEGGWTADDVPVVQQIELAWERCKY